MAPAARHNPTTSPHAAFPLGGLGTGTVGLGSRGELRDWEIFNRPGRGDGLPYTFFAIRTECDGVVDARVLEGRRSGPHESSHGYFPGDLAGLPRFAESTLVADYPLARVEFRDAAPPVEVALEAFNPLVPLDAVESAIPGAVLRYEVTNRSELPVRVTIAGSLFNAVGIDGYELFFFPRQHGTPRNEYRVEPGLRGIHCSSDLAPDDRRAGTMALTTRDGSGSAKQTWLQGAWWDGPQDFWNEFVADGTLALESAPPGAAGPLSEPSGIQVGSLAIEHELAPGETRAFEFALTWHFPHRPRAWEGHIILDDPHASEIVRNHYATVFEDAWHVARHLAESGEALEATTRQFSDALHGGTLPVAVRQAIAAGLASARSATCFRLEDGTFAAWEGTFDHAGSCEGTCTHVWNYAQTIAFLWPELERSARRVEFLLETDEHGDMAFRTNRIFGGAKWDMLPAVDGQLGTVVRLYREWAFSGDDSFLREVWPAAVRALEYAFGAWDSDGDSVLDSEQHNTYDIEFHGPNSLTNSVFFAALEAAARLAEHLGETERAAGYRERAAVGSRRMDELLWNGEYYGQALDDLDAHRYQYGTGCLADQVFGQFLAHVTGLGYVLPEEHVRSAIRAVHGHNFRRDLSEHHSVQRTYALNDESGLLLCTWPLGGRPRLPFVYSDEVWTGIEYQVAAHLAYDGRRAEALEIVEAVRARQDGVVRDAWNDVECGNHYARSMASWALLPAWNGVRWHAPDAALHLDPGAESGRTLFTTSTGWGVIDTDLAAGRARFEVRGGRLAAARVVVGPTTIHRALDLGPGETAEVTW